MQEFIRLRYERRCIRHLGPGLYLFACRVERLAQGVHHLVVAVGSNQGLHSLLAEEFIYAGELRSFSLLIGFPFLPWGVLYSEMGNKGKNGGTFTARPKIIKIKKIIG